MCASYNECSEGKTRVRDGETKGHSTLGAVVKEDLWPGPKIREISMWRQRSRQEPTVQKPKDGKELGMEERAWQDLGNPQSSTKNGY